MVQEMSKHQEIHAMARAELGPMAWASKAPMWSNTSPKHPWPGGKQEVQELSEARQEIHLLQESKR